MQMGMRGNLVIMDFSGVYEAEDFYRGYEYVWVNCRDIKGTNCYCDREAEAEIKKRIRETGQVKAGCPGIHFLDSGNCHYVSKIWLEEVKEDAELLVFDHHTDMQQPMFGEILSCGGWIREVLDSTPRIKRVWLAGPPREAWQETQAAGDSGGVEWISEDGMKDTAALRERLKGSSLPIYISLDKDVFSPAYARTNWDQGEAALTTVLECIGAAASCRRIIGMDVCGENPDGGEAGSAAQDCFINDNTNRKLICHFMKMCGIVS